MALQRPIVFGNWKMNGLREPGLELARRLLPAVGKGTLGIFPPATILGLVAEATAGTALVVGAQNAHAEDSGAFTGSISAPMIKDAGGVAVLLGHSECRQGLGEHDKDVLAKARASLRAGLLTVICVGETEAEREHGHRDQVLQRQIEGSVPPEAALEQLVVAYEPVWAIGTGKTPSTQDIVRAHLFIREQLGRLFSRGADIPILYGGSVKAGNAAEIMALDGVDGVLVGGASLDADTFIAIHRAGT